jgi:nucleoside diphosphate kinase
MKSKTTSRFNNNGTKLSPVELTPYLEEQIIEFYLKEKNNTYEAMKQKFGVSHYMISKTIDKYFSKI